MSYKGFLDQRVDVKRELSGSSDNQGGYAAPSWNVLYRRLPAKAIQLTKEDLQYWADQGDVKPDLIFQMWHKTGIQAGDSIFWKSREFRIIRYMPWQEDKKMVQAYVKEIDRI